MHSDLLQSNPASRRKAEFIATLKHYNLLEISETKYKTICPFHHDKNASLMIDIEESRFYCFGCGAHGSTLELISFYEPELSTNKKMILAHRYLRDSGKQEKLRVYIYNNIYNNNIYTEDKTNNILNSRDYYFGLPVTNWYLVTDKTDIQYKLYLHDRGFKYKTLNEVGCKLTYDSNYPIIFPIKDNGIFRGYVCRTTNKEIEAKRKYLYNKGFRRRDTLAGDYFGKTVIMVEGFMDMLKAKQCGFQSVVAILGWKLAVPQMEKLKKKGIKKIICALDNDDAGNRGYEYLQTLDFKVKRLQYPSGCKDFGDITAKTLPTIRKQIDNFGGY